MVYNLYLLLVCEIIFIDLVRWIILPSWNKSYLVKVFGITFILNQFTNILLVFPSIFIRDIGCNFFFCSEKVFTCFPLVGLVMKLLNNDLEKLPLFTIFWNSLRRIVLVLLCKFSRNFKTFLFDFVCWEFLITYSISILVYWSLQIIFPSWFSLENLWIS